MSGSTMTSQGPRLVVEGIIVLEFDYNINLLQSSAVTCRRCLHPRSQQGEASSSTTEQDAFEIFGGFFESDFTAAAEKTARQPPSGLGSRHAQGPYSAGTWQYLAKIGQYWPSVAVFVCFSVCFCSIRISALGSLHVMFASFALKVSKARCDFLHVSDQVTKRAFEGKIQRFEDM